MANLKTSKTSVNVGVDISKFNLYVYIHEKGIHLREEILLSAPSVGKTLVTLYCPI